MDKLDKHLQETKKTIKVSPDMADNIMNSIEQLPQPNQKYSFWRRHRLTIVSVPALGLVIVVLLTLAFKSNLTDLSKPTQTNSNQPSGSNNSNDQADGSVSAGTDNTSLASELSSVGSSLAENNQSFNAANAAIGDQQLDNVPSD